MKITSRDNPLLRQARTVRDGKVDELIFVEGLRLCVEALRSELEIEAVIASEELIRKEKAAEAFAKLSQASRRVATVSEKLLESISYTKTPQGIVVLAHRPESSEQRLSVGLRNKPLIVLLHQINNPVNVGAILRTAEAAGTTGIITTKTPAIRFHQNRCAARWARLFVCPFGGTRNSMKLSRGAGKKTSVWLALPPRRR